MVFNGEEYDANALIGFWNQWKNSPMPPFLKSSILAYKDEIVQQFATDGVEMPEDMKKFLGIK